MSEFPRIEQKELSFHGSKLLTGRHRIHPYPAMLHPLLVNWLLENFAAKDDVIFDPFCGSGVTLLESAVRGHDSIGFDINPLALLIAKTKTRVYRKSRLLTEFNDLKDAVLNSVETDIPEVKNAQYWYSTSVIRDLGRIRHVLNTKPFKYRDFFTTGFAYVCRNQSYTRNGEFKRYRINPEKLASAKNEVFEKFFQHVSEMIEVYLQSKPPTGRCKPMLANSETKIPPKISYDLVITSPPYGDSGTTVAYGQYTSFGSEWINGMNGYHNGNGNGYQIDKEGLGKVGEPNDELEDHETLTRTIKDIDRVDPRRAKEVYYFFNGYFNAVKNVVENLNGNGKICLVVGNRTVKGYQIPMDQITASFLDNMGLNFKGILVRDIHNKQGLAALALTLKETSQKLSEIKKRGYVKSLRRGPTGIGYTLETLLGIDENNVSTPDLGEIELKAQRSRHSGMTTLFTFNRNVWKMPPLEAIQKYGSEDANGRLGLYYSMGMKPNSAGLYLFVTSDSLLVRSIDGEIVAQWELQEIEKRFNEKVKNLLLVKADVDIRDGEEYFYFNRARLLTGGATQSILKNQFESEQLILELRLHDQGTSARNHGSAFRMNENGLENFYRKVEEVEF